MSWFLIALALVVLTVGIIRAARGPAYSLDTLVAPIRGLLRQGFNGGILFITVAGSKTFLQLSKYIHRPGEYGIELAFPKAEWSEPYYEKLKLLCDREGARMRISKAQPGDPLEFMFVDFGTDYVQAYNFVRRALTEVLDVSENARLYCRLENATPEDRLVES